MFKIQRSSRTVTGDTPNTSDASRPRRGVAHRIAPRVWHLGTPRPELHITQQALLDIAATVGAHPAETGGLLGGSRLDSVIDHYSFDHHGKRSRATYSPEVPALNALLREQWNPGGVELLGMVHSHPLGMPVPSGGDRRYAHEFFGAIAELDRLYLPIVQSLYDRGSFEMHGHVATPSVKGVDIGAVRMRVVPDPRAVPSPSEHAEFERVLGAYDVELLARTRVVAIGAGGSAAFLDDLVRCGVGEVVLVDPDVIEPRNTGTQQVYRSAVGRPKVEALADRLVEASPILHVLTAQASLDDLDDIMVERLCRSRLGARPAPRSTLLCGFTDDFFAQARVARIGLNLGIPTLAAQVYAEGRGAEVTFAVPGFTPACQRCVLGGRYRAIVDRGEVPAVGSSGTPLFATTRLNALKGPIALAILHGVAETPPNQAGERWRRLFSEIQTRNLVQVRLDPDISTTLGIPAFDRALAGADPQRFVADETIWLPQEPESHATGFAPCADCGGTGDLRGSIGKFADTRLVATVYSGAA